MTNIHRAENIIYEAVTGDGFSAPELRIRHAARALADAGLLAPEPQVVRTRDELAALDPDTMLATRGLVSSLPLEILWHLDSPPESVLSRDDLLPAVVIATGDQVRAAHRALGNADAVD